MEKRNTLQLILNEIKRDSSDPTILPCQFVILDFDVSANNVKVTKPVALEAGKTLLNKPIVAKYHRVSQSFAEDDNFGSHEEYLTKNKNGKDTIERDTIALGVFTTEGYFAEINVNGEMKEVMIADGVLWYSKYKDACDLLIEWYERGIKINTSCEYLYKNYSFIDGVEYHHSPIIFESHAILASENRGNHSVVTPAYESATLLSLNEVQEFIQLVAQANNQAKEDESVEEMEKEQVNSEMEIGNVDGQEEQLEEQSNENTEVVVETEVDAESETETVEECECKTIVNELQVKIDQLSSDNEDLRSKFNAASETIITLNSTIKELDSYREQLMTEQREKMLEEKMNHFSSKFEAIGAQEQFESEEVKSLIAQSIEDTTEGKDALLALNTMIVDLIEAKQNASSQDLQLLGLASYRKDLLKNEDSFESRYKIK